MLQTTKRVMNISDERRVGPLFFFPIAAFFLYSPPPAALSLTFITSILTIARKGERRREIQGEKKQNTFCQIDVDHLSYLSAVAAAAAEAG